MPVARASRRIARATGPRVAESAVNPGADAAVGVEDGGHTLVSRTEVAVAAGAVRSGRPWARMALSRSAARVKP
jgi:hypothetical protein